MNRRRSKEVDSSKGTSDKEMEGESCQQRPDYSASRQ